MPKPTGVTLIAVLYWIGACALIMLGVGILAASQIFAGMANPGWGWVLAMGKIGAIILIGFGGAAGFVGWGLWSMEEWARIVAIVLACLGIVASLPGFFLLHGVMLMPIRLVRLAINVAIIWYLFQPQVKRAFGTT